MDSYRPGTKVRIVGITDEDADLNGLTGRVCPKVRFQNFNPDVTFGEVGVLLDKPIGDTIKVNVLRKELRRI